MRASACNEAISGLLLDALLAQALAALARKTKEERGTSVLINNVGTLHLRLGKLAKARELLEEAVEACRVKLGDRDPGTLTAIANLGLVLKTLGDLEGAKPLYEEALAGEREALGDRHADTLVSINNLGLLLYNLGDLAGAKALYEAAPPLA